MNGDSGNSASGADYRPSVGLFSNANDRRMSLKPLELLRNEQLQSLSTWNQTTRRFPRDRGVHHLIAEQTERTPNGEAICFNSVSWSYIDLDRRVKVLAHELRKLGVTRESLVGICIERSPTVLVAMLAVLRAGGAYVPLDPSHPAARINLILEDAGPAVVIAQEGLEPGLALSAACVLLRIESVDFDRPGGEDPPEALFDESQLAYVMYTSGSTGRPKGVEVPHRALTNFLTSMARVPGFSPHDRILAITTISFDIAALELYLPLVQGGCIELADAATCLDATRLAQILEAGRVTMMQATPATWRMVLDTGILSARTSKGAAPSTRIRALCGGEAMSRGLRDNLIEHCTEVWNMYGPTETTVWSTCSAVHDRAGRAAPNARAIMIGAPIDNTQVFVVDDQSRPTPIGIVGELWIGGEGLARGYRGQPALTAERFVCAGGLAAAGLAEPNARFFKTGDLARFHADGQVECLERVDFQVKVRGFRIELGDIESVLLGAAGVEEAVVHTLGDGDDKRLVAYLRAKRGGGKLDVMQVCDHTKSGLPNYMVPAYFMEIAEFPRTPNGKVDRKLLPAPTRANALGRKLSGISLLGSEQRHTKARTPVEEVILDVWKQVLDLEVVHLEDDFFELGGHSLQAIRMIQQVNLRGLAVSPIELFRHRTVEGLAATIDTQVTEQMDGSGPKHKTLVTLREAKNRPRLFLLHSLPGDLLHYGNLVHALGRKVACYGFQSLGLHDIDKAHRTIEDMAECYVDVLTRFQPEGPYHLAGWCFGGNVAFEMARRLKSCGHAVGVVALLEAFPRRSLVGNALHRGRLLAGRGLGAFPFLATKAWESMRADARLDPRVDARSVFALDVVSGPFKNRALVYDLDFEALSRHRTGFHAGSVLLLRALDHPGDRLFAPDYGWKDFVEKVKTVAVQGHHDDLLGHEYVDAVARIIRTAIEASSTVDDA